MAINPVAVARTVNERVLRCRLTAFPLTDERLAQGPYLTLSKAFRLGTTVTDVIAQRTLHPAMAGILDYLKRVLSAAPA